MDEFLDFDEVPETVQPDDINHDFSDIRFLDRCSARRILAWCSTVEKNGYRRPCRHPFTIEEADLPRVFGCPPR